MFDRPPRIFCGGFDRGGGLHFADNRQHATIHALVTELAEDHGQAVDEGVADDFAAAQVSFRMRQGAHQLWDGKITQRSFFQVGIVHACSAAVFGDVVRGRVEKRRHRCHVRRLTHGEQRGFGLRER